MKKHPANLITSFISDQRFSTITNKDELEKNLRISNKTKSTIAELKVAFWFIDKGAQEIEYEPGGDGKSPDYRILFNDIEFYVEVKRINLDPAESNLISAASGFGDKARRKINDILRKAKKGHYPLFFVFLQVPPMISIRDARDHIKHGKNKLRITFHKDGLSSITDWTEDKTLSRNDHRFQCIDAVYVFHENPEDGNFEFNEASREKVERIFHCLRK